MRVWLSALLGIVLGAALAAAVGTAPTALVAPVLSLLLLAGALGFVSFMRIRP